jgi:hypothetical protein
MANKFLVSIKELGISHDEVLSILKEFKFQKKIYEEEPDIICEELEIIPINACSEIFNLPTTPRGFNYREFHERFPTHYDWRKASSQFYNSREYLDARMRVANRDKICVTCLIKGVKRVGNSLCHWNSVYQDPENAWNDQNLYWGCSKCHNEQHERD